MGIPMAFTAQITPSRWLPAPANPPGLRESIAANLCFPHSKRIMMIICFQPKTCIRNARFALRADETRFNSGFVRVNPDINSFTLNRLRFAQKMLMHYLGLIRSGPGVRRIIFKHAKH